MKAKIFRSWRLALAAVGLMVVAEGLWASFAIAEDASNGGDAPAAPAPVAAAPIADNQAAEAPVVVPSAQLSPGAAEVVKLAQAGMSEDVLLAYVGAAKVHFSLGSDQIVYLNDVGISGIVVKAMIQRDTAMNADAAIVAATNAPPTIPDVTAPNPPDDGSAPPAPPTDDSGATTATDNPGDYATADDTSYFYDSLSPYGAWVYVAGAGLCWQPTVCEVDRSWRPYSDRGRWLYTDCGWYWQSDYSWGWAPFHYGRWLKDAQRGWVWAPNRVWAPAWVSWRQSAEYCGWAPLPPAARFVAGVGFRSGNSFVGPTFEFGLTAHRYIFIPIERMTDAAPARYSLLPTQSAELYQQTKVANNFTVENNRVVSRSIDPQQVARLSGVEVRRAEIQVLQPTGGKNMPVEHLAKHDNKLVIYRPPLPKPDLNYSKKVTATAASSSSFTVSPANNRFRTAASEPMVLGRSPATPAAQAEHKSFIMMVPDRPFVGQPAAATATPRYPPNSLILAGPQNNSGTPQAPNEAAYNNGFDNASRYNHTHTSPMLADAQEQSKGQNNYSGQQSYYPPSSILTPSRSQNEGYGRQSPESPQYGHAEGQAPAYHPPILTPPAYSHTESAPAPVYHAESHPAPAETHSSPPPESHSSSGSSSSPSSSSSSGHK